MGQAPHLFIHTSRWGKVRIFPGGLQFFSHMIVYLTKQPFLNEWFVVNSMFGFLRNN